MLVLSAVKPFSRPSAPYQAFIDNLGCKEGGQVLHIVRRADCVYVDRNMNPAVEWP